MTKFYLSLNRYLTVLLFLVATVAWSQSRTVAGKVTSGEDGTGLPGVNVVEKGTSNGTATDADGNFSLNVGGTNSILVFTFVGYATQEVLVGNQSNVNITLLPDVTSLSEVVVIGYGQQEKKDATGAVLVLSDREFNQGVISSPEQLLQGRAAGVQVTPSSGEPGASANIRIRGTSSVRSNNNPLFVVDGVPLAGSDVTPGGANYGAGDGPARNPLNFLNPDDIESVSILKDASASAIYGARGANGVVLITTKKGKPGQNLTFSVSTSVSTRLKKIDLLEAGEYVDAAVNAGAVASVVNFGGSTDWQDEIFRTGKTQNYSLGFSGGSEQSNYRFSFGYMDQEGIIKNTSLERITGRINAGHKLFDDKIVLDLQLTASRVNDQYAPLGRNAGFEGNLIGAALQANPTRPIYQPDGTFTQGSDFRNPLAMLAYIDDHANTDRILANIGATWNIIEGLSYRINAGFDNSTGVRRTGIDKKLNFNNILNRGRGIIDNRYLTNKLIEHTLNFNKALGKNRLDAVVGFSYQSFESRGDSLQAEYFTTDLIPIVDNIDGVDNNNNKAFTAASYRSVEELQSFFGRVNYNILDKYILTATVRADGSTKFGENNKYGVFPSLAAAWRLSDEAFVPDALYDLKIRAGWGITGNQEFPGNASKSVQRYNNQGGLVTENFFNPDLRWEETTQWSLGVDFALMGGRLSGAVDYFNKTTRDLIIRKDFPAPSFVPTRWENLPGEVKNTGVEFSLDYRVVDQANFSWQVMYNMTILRNKIQNFGTTAINTGEINGQGLSGAYAQRIADGKPLYAFYMRQFAGYDEQGLGIYANDERLAFVGDPFPDFTFGLTNNFTFGKFDASLFINGATGFNIYNNTANAIFLKGNLRNGRNVTRDEAYGPENPANFGEVSTRFLEKGDFVRISNLSLGYKFDMSDNKYIKSLRVSLTGQNLLLFTGYAGYDPEVNTNKAINGVPSLGIDYTTVPSARTFTLGLNVGF